MKKAARAEREKAKKEKMELERAARIQSLVLINSTHEVTFKTYPTQYQTSNLNP